MSETVTKLLVEDYAKKQGVEVKIKYLPEGSFAEKLDFLRDNKFDCWLGGTAEECYLADQQSLLSPYKPQEFYKMPAELRSRQGQWISLYLEYIAFISNTSKLRDNGLYAPDTWQELLQPEFKNEIAMPDFVDGGASYGMITSIWQLRGKDTALDFASKLNRQNLIYTDTSEEAVEMVHSGEKMVAVVPLRTAILLETKHKHLFATVVKDANRNLLNCVAVMNKAENIDEAHSFVDYLISDDSEALLRSKGYHYIWHAKNYPYNDGRKELIGNVKVPVDDLSWTAVEKNDIISQWLKAW
jgi:ABC-type Fe3+ transport system substrate-binding protein